MWSVRYVKTGCSKTELIEITWGTAEYFNNDLYDGDRITDYAWNVSVTFDSILPMWYLITTLIKIILEFDHTQQELHQEYDHHTWSLAKRFWQQTQFAIPSICCCPKTLRQELYQITWSQRISPALKFLHWLPFDAKITYKVCFLSFKLSNDLAKYSWALSFTQLWGGYGLRKPVCWGSQKLIIFSSWFFSVAGPNYDHMCPIMWLLYFPLACVPKQGREIPTYSP